MAPPPVGLTIDLAAFAALPLEERQKIVEDLHDHNERLRQARKEREEGAHAAYDSGYSYDSTYRGRGGNGYRGGNRGRGRGGNRGNYRGSYYGGRGVSSLGNTTSSGRQRHNLEARGEYGPYHPYTAPQLGPQTYPNLSMTSNHQSTTAGTQFKKSSQRSTKSTTPCSIFTSTGVCSRAACPDVHDENKTAICKRHLYQGSCLQGNACPLSHKPSPHNSPHCYHFQAGLCSKEDCRFVHVHVSPDAPVCEAFGRLHYCEKGDKCTDLHTFQCPDFSNRGFCAAGDACPLRHTRHAGRLRQAAERRSPLDAGSALSLSTPVNGTRDDEAAETLASDGLDSTNGVDAAHALSLQADFVPLE